MWIQSLFLALLLVILFQSRYFPARNFKSLRYRRRFIPDVANVGETVTLVEEIGNARLLPIPWLQVEAAVSPDLVFGQGKNQPFFHPRLHHHHPPPPGLLPQTGLLPHQIRGHDHRRRAGHER